MYMIIDLKGLGDTLLGQSLRTYNRKVYMRNVNSRGW